MSAPDKPAVVREWNRGTGGGPWRRYRVDLAIARVVDGRPVIDAQVVRCSTRFGLNKAVVIAVTAFFHEFWSHGDQVSSRLDSIVNLAVEDIGEGTGPDDLGDPWEF